MSGYTDGGKLLTRAIRCDPVGSAPQALSETHAKVNQWFSLLKLPEGERKRILAMGDHWERRIVMERSPREMESRSG